MCKNIIITIFILFIFITSIYSENTSAIKVRPGINLISVRIQNNTAVDLSKLRVEVDDSIMPKGISITTGSQSLNVVSKSKSGECLQLQINVAENIEIEDFRIAFSVKDDLNNSWEFDFEIIIDKIIPLKYELFQNFPNPFNASTQIKYSLSFLNDQRVQLNIYNVLGQKICKLVDEKQQAGTYKVIWDGKDYNGKQVSSGVYIYRITCNQFSDIKKMLLIE